MKGLLIALLAASFAGQARAEQAPTGEPGRIDAIAINLPLPESPFSAQRLAGERACVRRDDCSIVFFDLGLSPQAVQTFTQLGQGQAILDAVKAGGVRYTTEDVREAGYGLYVDDSDTPRFYKLPGTPTTAAVDWRVVYNAIDAMDVRTLMDGNDDFPVDNLADIEADRSKHYASASVGALREIGYDVVVLDDGEFRLIPRKGHRRNPCQFIKQQFETAAAVRSNILTNAAALDKN